MKTPTPDDATRPVSSANDTAIAPSLMVVYSRDHARVGQRTTLRRTMAIGRGTTDFGGEPFEDPRMSREHATFVLEDDRLLVIDGGSTNGTLVNDRPVRRAYLELGDVVQIGTTFFEYGLHRVARPFFGEGAVHGVSAAMETLWSELALVSPTGTTVLVEGAFGVGKRTVAREIHRLSGRSGPLLSVECGASSPEDVERRLFGDELTGPVMDVMGPPNSVLDVPDSTLLLVDVDRLSVRAQVRLFWALEQQARQRAQADALPRLIVTTQEDLDELVTTGRFRADLYQKLMAWQVDVLPLRARRADVGALLAELIDTWVAANRSRSLYAESRLVWRLLRHEWPRNVAELARLVEVACVEAAASDGVLQETPRLQRLLDGPSHREEVPGHLSVPPPRTRDELVAALERYDYVIAHVARHYGKHRQQVYRWLDRFRVDVDALRIARG